MTAVISHFQYIYFVFYFTIAIFSGFTIPYLNNLDFSNTKVGFMMSLLYLFGVIGQSLTGYICDLKGTIKKIFFLWMVFLATSIFIFFKLNSQTQLIIFLCIIGFFQSSVFALLDSWVMESHEIVKNTFGPIRAFGSIGWGISTVIVGKMIDKLGWGIIGKLYVIFTFILLLISYRAKDAKHDTHDMDTDPITFNSLKALQKNKKYIFLLVIFFLLYFSFHAIGMFSVILIDDFGGTKTHIGLFWLLTALSEVPILLNAKKLMNKLKPSFLLIISSFFFFLRTLLTAFANSVISIILLSTLQMLSFSILLFISKYLIDDVSPNHLKTSSQTIATALSAGLSGIISLNLSGYLADKIGIQNMLFFVSCLCIIGFVLSIKYYKEDILN
ncbi:MFS transporter [Wukongibacter baidiensis]|uniref:MFS transporter n=1 Tax=Wukongibacter baidiensis TaxID=1723361 RepID=UPI003D7F4814